VAKGPQEVTHRQSQSIRYSIGEDTFVHDHPKDDSIVVGKTPTMYRANSGQYEQDPNFDVDLKDLSHLNNISMSLNPNGRVFY